MSANTQTLPPNMQPKEQPRGRKLPTIYKGGVIKIEWFRTFGLWERLHILFGGGLVVMIGVATQHKAGEFQPLVIGKVSKHTNADAHMKAAVENMIETIDKESKSK